MEWNHSIQITSKELKPLLTIGINQTHLKKEMVDLVVDQETSTLVYNHGKHTILVEDVLKETLVVMDMVILVEVDLHGV